MTEFPVAKDGLPVGLLFSDQSLTATVETTQLQASLLAIEEVNASGGVGGVPLCPLTQTIGPDPQDYRQAAEALCAQDCVRILLGTHMSNQRKAVLPLVEQRDCLLFYPTLYEGFEYSKNCIYTGAAPNQNSVQLARFALRHVGGRVLFIGNNYIFAHESNRIMRELFEDGGGHVLDEVYLPLNATQDQMAAVMRRAEQLAPDAIYSTVVGADTLKLYEAFARTSLRTSGVPILSLATNEADLHGMSADVAEGHISVAPYFQSLDTAANHKFVETYQSRFGTGSAISAGAEAAYFQVHLFAKAARRASEISLAAILDGLGGEPFDAPQGPVRIDPENHHTYLWPRVGQVNAQREFVVVQEEAVAIAPHPYMIQHSFADDISETA